MVQDGRGMVGMHARVEGGGGGRRYNIHIIIVYLCFHRSVGFLCMV